MNKKMLDFLKTQKHRLDGIVWDNGLMRRNGSGHTHEVADLKVVHAGRDSANAYLFGRVTGSIDAVHGLEILKAISELQVIDEKAERYGGFRWYREESAPIDTNAAFFNMVPLVIMRLFAPDCIEADELSEIDSMFEKAYHWFSKECENPILFYTNKIVSDGAMLTAIGHITGKIEFIEQSRRFLIKWLDYTEKRGYGWGENMSPGYNGITLQGFAIIKKALGDNPDDNDIRRRFDSLEEDILETFRFHSGHEFVPAIRSYNVNGKTGITSFLYNLSKVGGFGVKEFFGNGHEPDDNSIFNMAKTLLVFGERLYFDDAGFVEKQPVPRKKVTRIMDRKFAYSWLGRNGGIGSINEFPIIDGSYQHKKWGLGWQCFPVSAIVYDKQVSFLRFNTDCGDRIRNHPHMNKHRDFLDPALFSESYYPDVRTNCAQHQNTVIAIRSISKLRNSVKSISDSFDVQRFDGEVIEVVANDRRWIALLYDNTCICLTSLMGIREESDEYSLMNIEVSMVKGDLRLIQLMYCGEMKTLFNDRLSTGWVIQYIDESMNKKEIQEYLNKIQVIENCLPDGEIPRMPVWNIHNIKVSCDDVEIVSFRHDPYI